MSDKAMAADKSSRNESQKGSRKTELSKKVISAKKALPEINRLTKLPLPDREIFARNLGEMFLAAKSANSRLSFQVVLEDAFGEDIATSLVKKRKSLILFGQESDETLPLLAGPYKYLQTAKSLAKYMNFQVEGVDQEILAISQLIDSSSFDKKIDIKEEVEEQTISLVRSAIKKIVATVTESVDFRQIYILSKDHDYFTAGSTGQLRGLYGKGGGMYLDISEKNAINNNCIPCVNLGVKRFPANEYSNLWGFYFEIDTPEEGWGEDENFTSSEIKILRNHLNSYFSSLGIKCDDHYVEDSLYSIKEKVPAEDLRHQFDMPHIHQQIDLELRYSSIENKILPAIVTRIKTDELGRIIDFEDDLSTMYYSVFSHEPATHILLLEDYDDGGLMAINTIRGAAREKSEYFIFHSPVDLYDFYKHCPRDIEETITWIDSDEFHNKILEAHDNFLSPRDESLLGLNGYVPAPKDSIASIILRNIAYFPKESKLDRLLLRDAIHKRDTILKILNEKENEFRESYNNWIGGN